MTVKPSDWGIGVTVCAVAVCEDGRGIVAVCDRLMTADSVSTESVLKAARIHGRWMALVAGEDVGYAPGVLQDAREHLIERRGTASEVRQAFEDACAREIAHKVYPVLAKYSITLDELKAGPSPKLHQLFYNQVMREIQRAGSLDLECSFLVCGFGPEHGDEAVVFEVQPNGKIRQFQDLVNFWAIGSGQKHAVKALTERQYGPRTKFSVAVYCVCEAKFRAEKDRGVGRRTWLFLLDHDGLHIQMGETRLMQDIRAACTKQGPVPSALTERIAAIIPLRFNEYE